MIVNLYYLACRFQQRTNVNVEEICFAFKTNGIFFSKAASNHVILKTPWSHNYGKHLPSVK